jgi:DNA-binding transcriptional MerR regulator
VKLQDLINSVQSRVGKFSVERKTKKALRSYRNSGEVKFPRLYGYRQTAAGIVVVEPEARIIRLILQLLSAGKSVSEIKHYLDEMNLRSRSGNRFTEREIRAMAKPVYAGLIQIHSGRWVKSDFYEPIVSVEILKNAQKATERLSEGLNFGFPALDRGVFLTLAG